MPTPRCRICFSFGPAPFDQSWLGKVIDEPLLLSVGQQAFAFELLGNRPAFVAIETEDQGGRASRLVVSRRHQLQLLVEELIAHPNIGQGDLPLGALNEFDFSIETPIEPDDEFGRIADGRRQHHHAHMLGKHRERQFPNDASLGIGKAVEFVHHDRGDRGKIEGLADAASD